MLGMAGPADWCFACPTYRAQKLHLCEQPQAPAPWHLHTPQLPVRGQVLLKICSQWRVVTRFSLHPAVDPNPMENNTQKGKYSSRSSF